MSSDNLIPITAAEVGIPATSFEVQTNICYFVADNDRNPLTIETFLPKELASAALQASQIQVDCQKSIRSD